MVVRAYRSLEQLTVATIDASIRFKLYIYLAKITEHDNCLHEWSTFTEGRIFRYEDYIDGGCERS